MERIGLARKEDVELVAKLYDSVNEYFERNTNFCYPNWQKGKYPVLRDAQEGFEGDGGSYSGSGGEEYAPP